MFYHHQRIIPTRVGTSYSIQLRAAVTEDHPHACGDNSRYFQQVILILGSSPRVWGQDCPRFFKGNCIPIIPTRVGTRYLCLLLWLFHWDHPHACGDKLASAFNMDKVEGSSPRVWGQASWDKIFEEFPRIIPTRVGTSSLHFGYERLNGDHPHACGDKMTIYEKMNFISGSSPRVWGQVKKI